jgi:hypothetical protein
MQIRSGRLKLLLKQRQSPKEPVYTWIPGIDSPVPAKFVEINKDRRDLSIPIIDEEFGYGYNHFTNEFEWHRKDIYKGFVNSRGNILTYRSAGTKQRERNLSYS